MLGTSIVKVVKLSEKNHAGSDFNLRISWFLRFQTELSCDLLC